MIFKFLVVSLTYDDYESFYLRHFPTCTPYTFCVPMRTFHVPIREMYWVVTIVTNLLLLFV